MLHSGQAMIKAAGTGCGILPGTIVHTDGTEEDGRTRGTIITDGILAVVGTDGMTHGLIHGITVGTLLGTIAGIPHIITAITIMTGIILAITEAVAITMHTTVLQERSVMDVSTTAVLAEFQMAVLPHIVPAHSEAQV